ncbi:transcriptional regulator, LacI family [Sulfobacillus thermosulfidooxidans DSM 9293]|uniref:Transcriptional regulator, LacI family n=2 Tax=Sulfobacillus thermosulfidooxidans TaxID=28034 RepID=A0A1W1WIC1_SULTA|nr:LacI family DNA-binding transcriptional regulator [Sulfobacillus thermosulfidooxidans]SMC05780.1 transcriptional regulator, LacI family [Sulfobacillus thermosulfidooxidans DSM 9293]
MSTMQDVAKRAHVSVTTVSRVLNGDSRVKADTRARVERVMAAMGYQPNLVARSLRRQSSHVIGLIVDTLDNPFTAELSQALTAHLSQAGYQLILADTERQSQHGPAMLRMLAQRGVDGILFAAGWDKDPEPLAVECGILQRNGIPTIIVGNILQSVPSIAVDHYGGTRKAVDYLYQLGHKHIAFISGAHETETSRLRRQGFIEATRTLGIEQALVFSSYGSPKRASQIVRELVSSSPLITAIVAASDYVAIGVLHGLYNLGLNVPRDMSVFGFDNVKMSQFLCPALTTIDGEIDKLAHQAWTMIYELMQDPMAHNNPEVLAPHVVVRESTYRPRGSKFIEVPHNTI